MVNNYNNIDNNEPNSSAVLIEIAQTVKPAMRSNESSIQIKTKPKLAKKNSTGIDFKKQKLSDIKPTKSKSIFSILDELEKIYPKIKKQFKQKPLKKQCAKPSYQTSLKKLAIPGNEKILVRDPLFPDKILIGPQNSYEVDMPDTWHPAVSNVNDALDLLKTWTSAISDDTILIKNNIQEISSNIENALEDIINYEPIDQSSKVSDLRNRVNALQVLIKNLYDKF